MCYVYYSLTSKMQQGKQGYSATLAIHMDGKDEDDTAIILARVVYQYVHDKILNSNIQCWTAKSRKCILCLIPFFSL